MSKHCGFAAASMVMGIGCVILCCLPDTDPIVLLLGISAIILGVLGKNSIESSNNEVKGKKMAIVGIILGIISIGLNTLILIAFASLIGVVNNL